MNRKDLEHLAATVRLHLPRNSGFALLVFDHGDGGTMNYVSDAKREQMVSALVELLVHLLDNANPSATIASLEATIKAMKDRLC